MRFRFLHILWKGREALVWLGGLALLATMDPDACHGTLCPFARMGIEWCPGCGLGHSIAWLFRGSLGQSLQAHPLGIPAFVLLLHRSITVLKHQLTYHAYGTRSEIRT